MRSRSGWLLAAVIAAMAVVAAVALRTLAADAERARVKYAEQLDGVARGLANELQRAATLAASHPDAIRWRASVGAELIEPSIAARAAPDAAVSRLRADLERELDRLEREGGVDAVGARLQMLATTAMRPELAAWVLLVQGAHAKRGGDLAAARAAWQSVVERHASTRDERGLRHAHAARNELLAIDGEHLGELVALHDELLRDRSSLEDTAGAAMAESLLRRIEARDPAAAEAARLRLLAAARPLRLAAAWSRGISEWVASGAPGGLRLLELPADPVGGPTSPARLSTVALIGAKQDEAGWSGFAVELAALCSTSLQAAARAGWSELGVAAAVHAPDGSIIAGETTPIDAIAADAPLEAPLRGCNVRVYGKDYAAFEAEEKRRYWLIVAATIGALLLASVAGWATVRALRREERTLREREQFVAAVTHELKTPLASIRLLAELIESGDLAPETVRDFSARTVRESDRLAKLVDSVLRYARLEHGLRPEQLQPLELEELAKAALQATRALAAERGFELRLSHVPIKIVVRGEYEALLSAVSELVENATKYGAAAEGIELCVRVHAGRARIEVLDRGRGVPDAERERIFEPFQRLGDELTRERAGVGLGLALVRGVAQAHGGEAGCSSREGGGSCFWMELPIAATGAGT
jgi:signal transduction histidine kinase